MTEQIRVFPIKVCKGCFELQSGQCHNSKCVFYCQHAPIIRRVLDYVKIRPIVDKKPLDMGKYEDNSYSADTMEDLLTKG